MRQTSAVCQPAFHFTASSSSDVRSSFA